MISTGSGCTGALELLQKILGTYIAPKTMDNMKELMTIEDIKNQLRLRKKLPLVVVTGYEHHSNEITWKKQICDVKKVPINREGFLDLNFLD